MGQDSKPKTNRKQLIGVVIAGFVTIFVFCGAFFISITNSASSSGTRPPRPTKTSVPTATASPTWEEWREQSEQIPYKTLFRYAEDNVGGIFHFRGRVIQVREQGAGDAIMRIGVVQNGDSLWSSDVVYVRYRNMTTRILEDDIVAFVGEMKGLKTYNTVIGSVTVPELEVLSLIIESESQ